MKYIINSNILKKAMVGKNIGSMALLSKESSVHRNTILGYLSGKSVFLDTFTQIADHLGLDPLELITPASETKAKAENIDEIKQIIAALTKTKKGCAVILLGSRAKGRAKKYSDWDIGITGGTNPISSSEYLTMKNKVDELSEDLPRTVDLVNLDSAPAWFLKAIDYEPQFLDGNKEAFIYFKGVLYGAKKDEEI